MSITIPPWLLWAIVIFTVKFAAAVVITLIKMNGKLGGIGESLNRGERLFEMQAKRNDLFERRLVRLETTCALQHGAPAPITETKL